MFWCSPHPRRRWHSGADGRMARSRRSLLPVVLTAVCSRSRGRFRIAQAHRCEPDGCCCCRMSACFRTSRSIFSTIRRAPAGAVQLALVLRRRALHHRPVALAHPRCRHLARAAVDERGLCAAGADHSRRFTSPPWAWPRVQRENRHRCLEQPARGRAARRDGGPRARHAVHPRQVIVDAGRDYETRDFRACCRRASTFDGTAIPKNDADPRVARAREVPRIRAFLVWSRFPFWTIDETVRTVRASASATCASPAIRRRASKRQR